jgi:hypothetical protein
MKHLVTSGCSFTRAGRINIDVTDNNILNEDHKEIYYFSHQLKILNPNLNVINVANVTNDNQSIARSIIYKIEKLKKEGIDTSDISVIVQWSSFYRNSFFVSPSKIKENPKLKLPQHRRRWDDDYAHINDFVEEKSEMGENGYYFLSGGFFMEHIKNPMKEFAALNLGWVHSYEERMLCFLETIVMLQLYLKSNNIKYKMFNIANNFSDTYVLNLIKSGGFPRFKPEYSKHNELYEILYNKYVPNTWNDSMRYKDNPYLNYYWNLIDWNSFWFYEEENIHKYGGVTEWAIKNFDINDTSTNQEYHNILFMEQSKNNKPFKTFDEMLENYEDWRCPLGHVSAKMYNKFVKDIILKWELF